MTGLHKMSAGAVADELRLVLGARTALPETLVGQMDVPRAYTALERLREGLRQLHPGEDFHDVLASAPGLAGERRPNLSCAAMVADHLVIFLLEVGQGTCPVSGERLGESHLSTCPQHRQLSEGLIRSYVAALEPGDEGDAFMLPYREALMEMRAAAEEAVADALPVYELRCRTGAGAAQVVPVPVATDYQVTCIRRDAELFGRDAGLVGTYAESLVSFAKFLGVERLDDVQFDMARRMFYVARGLPHGDGGDSRGG